MPVREGIRERKMRLPTPPANSSPSLRVRISPRSRSIEPGTSGITLLDPSGCPRGGGDLLCGECGGVLTTAAG
jgi:hypothetical protein